jgi:8-oxo-dGTP pyrophosphatase MutT (NUDIX family)
MIKLRNATLVFLIRKSQGEISAVCLAMKKRGFGMGRWNGVGGKVEEREESIEDAARREAKEEIFVTVDALDKVAELSFRFPHNPAWDQLVHVYFAHQWVGEPKESEEMKPQWFPINEIPFEHMWPDDIFWLPNVLQGSRVRATFEFGEKDVVLSKEVTLVDTL